tara:strand:+ start:9085 stop:9594 length:510 start_codon:yes stop_codon:yes gene_type:complete
MVTTKALATLFEDLHHITPFTIGFDRMFNTLSNWSEQHNTNVGYPPYNIRKEKVPNSEGEEIYLIEMALAGFTKENIEVILTHEDRANVLTIASLDNKLKNATTDRPTKLGDLEDDIYRGISHRKFERKFTLADDIIVIDAKMENGMLVVRLERDIPPEKKPRKISITG